MKKGLKNIVGKLKAIFFGILIGLLFCEIILRVYNPFPFMNKAGKLLLPANQSKVFQNTWIKKLDKEIHYSKNSLGFRGPDPTSLSQNRISILTIGGSTTECKFLSDSCTWPFLLAKVLQNKDTTIWLNNAGIDGHSTFGHILLMNELAKKLKPQFAIFLLGVNDVELDKADEFDLMTEQKINTRSIKLFLKSLLNHTEVGRTAFGFYQVHQAYKKGLIHREINLVDLVESNVSDTYAQEILKKQIPFLTAYKTRIDSIVKICKMASIQPILITQPSLLGSFTDSLTGIATGSKWLKTEQGKTNCSMQQQVLNLYNKVLLSYGKEIPVIDLDAMMPKNSFYYYDFIHFTNSGAKKVAEILGPEIGKIIFSRHTL